MATRLKDTDVVIIGLGAAGGVASLPLSLAGLEVIGLEAGGAMTRRDFAPDEIRNNYRQWPMLASHKQAQEAPTVRATAAQTAVQGGAPMMNAVGGTSLHYWAQHWRLNPWDFKVVSETTRRYGASRIPKGSTVEDWPFGYDEIEAYYDKIEYELGVSGAAGNVNGKVDPRGNVFEGPRKRDYPMPPLRWTSFHEKMAGAAKQLGWKPFPGPAAINSRTYQNRSGCMYHGFCNTGGCHVDAKNSTAVTTIPRAEKTGHFKAVTGAIATTIDVDAQGRASGVTYLQNGEEFFQPAKVVLLASFAYENTRLLLLSKSAAYPKGLSNNHGQVGRHYFSHHQGAPVTALFPFDVGAWYGLPAQGVAIDDWADDNFDHAKYDFIGGANLWAMSDRRPIGASSMNTFGLAPAWGSQWKAFIKQNADRSHSSYIQKTTLPYETNYLDLDPTVKDPLGRPVIRITGEYKENERKIAEFSQDKMEEWYRAAGATAVVRAPVGGAMTAATHAYGGTRMGTNPETNVLNQWGMSHEVPNLGVLGASVMGTSGARNPTHTAQALAWRTADHIIKEWKSLA